MLNLSPRVVAFALGGVETLKKIVVVAGVVAVAVVVIIIILQIGDATGLTSVGDFEFGRALLKSVIVTTKVSDGVGETDVSVDDQRVEERRGREDPRDSVEVDVPSAVDGGDTDAVLANIGVGTGEREDEVAVADFGDFAADDLFDDFTIRVADTQDDVGTANATSGSAVGSEAGELDEVAENESAIPDSSSEGSTSGTGSGSDLAGADVGHFHGAGERGEFITSQAIVRQILLARGTKVTGGTVVAQKFLGTVRQNKNCFVCAERFVVTDDIQKIVA